MTAALFPDLIVNGEIVPHAQVAAEAQNHDAPKGKPGIAWRKAANAVAIRTLLLQEARRRDLVADPSEIAPGRFETEEEALIRGLLDAALHPAPPTLEQIRAEYDRDPARFRSPPLWEVSHILCATGTTPADEAQARARALTADVLARPRSFAAVARRESDCGSAANGGALGQLGPGDTVPEFEAALRGLSEGEITSDPVFSRHGWHVIRMDAVAPGRVLPFEAVRDRISEALEKRDWTIAARDFANQLVAEANISGADLPRE